jgi:hypothetical protein
MAALRGEFGLDVVNLRADVSKTVHTTKKGYRQNGVIFE